MGAEHFRDLDHERAGVAEHVDVAALRGAHLALADWRMGARATWATALADYAECFVVPISGAATLTTGGESLALAPGALAYVPAPAREAAVEGAECRYVVVGWPRAANDPPPAAPPPAPRLYHFDAALRPEAPGWRFFSVDGAYLTVGCSYREALPPARERPHDHDGEQINLPLAGKFAFTVGDHTQALAPGWAALTPRGVQHTGLHLELPYFQLIFGTPPRGQGYAEFLRGIYRAEESRA